MHMGHPGGTYGEQGDHRGEPAHSTRRGELGKPRTREHRHSGPKRGHHTVVLGAGESPETQARASGVGNGLSLGEDLDEVCAL